MVSPHPSPELCAIALERLAQPYIASGAALGLFSIPAEDDTGDHDSREPRRGPATAAEDEKQQQQQRWWYPQAALALQHRIDVIATTTGLEQARTLLSSPAAFLHTLPNASVQCPQLLLKQDLLVAVSTTGKISVIGWPAGEGSNGSASTLAESTECTDGGLIAVCCKPYEYASEPCSRWMLLASTRMMIYGCCISWAWPNGPIQVAKRFAISSVSVLRTMGEELVAIKGKLRSGGMSWQRMFQESTYRQVQSLAFVSAKRQIAARDALDKQLVCVLWEEGGVRSVYRHMSLIAVERNSSSRSTSDLVWTMRNVHPTSSFLLQGISSTTRRDQVAIVSSTGVLFIDSSGVKIEEVSYHLSGPPIAVNHCTCPESDLLVIVIGDSTGDSLAICVANRRGIHTQRSVRMWPSGSQPIYGALRPIAAPKSPEHEHRRIFILGLFGGVPESRIQALEVSETTLSIQTGDGNEPLVMFPNAMYPPRSIQVKGSHHLISVGGTWPMARLESILLGAEIALQPMGVFESEGSLEDEHKADREMTIDVPSAMIACSIPSGELIALVSWKVKSSTFVFVSKTMANAARPSTSRADPPLEVPIGQCITSTMPAPLTDDAVVALQFSQRHSILITVTTSSILGLQPGPTREEQGHPEFEIKHHLRRPLGGSSIQLASFSPDTAMLAVSSRDLVCIFDIESDEIGERQDLGCRITEIARFSLLSQVSCLQLITASSPSPSPMHVACGLWGNNSVELRAVLPSAATDDDPRPSSTCVFASQVRCILQSRSDPHCILVSTTSSVHRCRFHTATNVNTATVEFAICDTIHLGLKEAALLLRVASDANSETMLAVCGPQVCALGLGERGELQGTSCVHKGAPICKAASSDRSVWAFNADGLVCAVKIDMTIKPRTTHFQTRGTPLLVALDDGDGDSGSMIACIEETQDLLECLCIYDSTSHDLIGLTKLDREYDSHQVVLDSQDHLRARAYVVQFHRTSQKAVICTYGISRGKDGEILQIVLDGYYVFDDCLRHLSIQLLDRHSSLKPCFIVHTIHAMDDTYVCYTMRVNDRKDVLSKLAARLCSQKAGTINVQDIFAEGMELRSMLQGPYSTTIPGQCRMIKGISIPGLHPEAAAGFVDGDDDSEDGDDDDDDVVVAAVTDLGWLGVINAEIFFQYRSTHPAPTPRLQWHFYRSEADVRLIDPALGTLCCLSMPGSVAAVLMVPCSSIAVLDRDRTTINLLHYSIARSKSSSSSSSPSDGDAPVAAASGAVVTAGLYPIASIPLSSAAQLIHPAPRSWRRSPSPDWPDVGCEKALAKLVAFGVDGSVSLMSMAQEARCPPAHSASLQSNNERR